jgi:NAD(P)-dependent dehydrogenase (short-subunit alcohol dehydrogenase family)
MGRLDGKVSVVTGGATGIGRAAVRALTAEGSAAVLGDVDERGGQAVAEELRAGGAAATFVRADVRSMADVRRLVSTAVEEHGGLDVIVNNAAVAIPGSAGEISEEDWRDVLEVNLSGVWRGMRCAIPIMLERGSGSIVNIGSVQSHVGFLGWAGYAAAKGGVDALTRQAAVEYATRGIRVNAIVPGTILTEMNEKIMRDSGDPDAQMRQWVSMHPMGRIGQPEEVAAAVVFLASDESSFVTGAHLRVDGGMIVKAG